MRHVHPRPVRLRPVLVAFLLLCGWIAVACTWEPYAPTPEPDLVPPGESEPVVTADPNPLDSPRTIRTNCTPQGRPVVEDDATRDCERDEACRIVCVDIPQ